MPAIDTQPVDIVEGMPSIPWRKILGRVITLATGDLVRKTGRVNDSGGTIPINPSVGQASQSRAVLNPTQDQLLIASHTRGQKVYLQFLDGFYGELDIGVVGLKTGRLNLASIRASSWSGSAE